MYDHTKQFRCSIIRGKSQSEMDNLLPQYAKIIDEICPCGIDEFKEAFDNAIRPYLKAKERNKKEPLQKTFNNHRTEIAKCLFGMYYVSNENVVYSSDRTKKFLSDGDTPAFFKDICYKMQFPSGAAAYRKSETESNLYTQLHNKLSIRQFPFILKVMLLAKSNNIILTKKEIGYYILNSLDVLQGNATPLEVYDVIASDREQWKEAVRDPGSGSYAMQHITEQINLLELANLVIISGDEVAINQREIKSIQLFAEKYADKPEFDIYSYDLENTEIKKQFYLDWDYYFSQLSNVSSEFETTADALGAPTIPDTLSEEEMENVKTSSTMEIGDEGERYVFEYEKQRVIKFNFRLAGKVLHLGKTKGLGYDIQSVVAKEGDTAEFVKYIEVKSTKRVTAPDISDDNWVDTLNITRNEWIASQQHKESYSIFRVYFTRGSVIMFVLTNIAQKASEGIIEVVPTTYRLDFSNNAVDEII